MGKKWSKERRARFQLKRAAIGLKPLEVPKNMLNQCQIPAVGQTPAVDVGRERERAYRQGLMTALECIIRELR